jgi:hypothetical protein
MMMMIVSVQITTTLNCLNVQSLNITFSQGMLRAERTDTIAVDRLIYSGGKLRDSSVSLLTLVINIVKHVVSITIGTERLITTDFRLISQR